MIKKIYNTTHKIILLSIAFLILAGGAFYLSNNQINLPTSNSPVDTLEQAMQMTNLETQKPQEALVTFLAVGDISLSRGIAYAIDKNGGDTNLPFRNISDLLNSTDFNFGNLETPFSPSDKYTAKETLVFNAPKKNIAGLVNHNFKVLSLANNHAFDQGLAGIKTTRQWLTENNILFTGVGETLDEAWMPALIEKNGIKVAFLAVSYTSINDGGKTRNNYVARMEDLPRLISQISSLKSHADFIVVSMHAGTEYTEKPNEAQVNFAHSAIEAGADMVIGHHPHWVQEKELYCSQKIEAKPSSPAKGRSSVRREGSVITTSEINNCKPIYYSLGNFVFDQSWSQKTKEGLALKITLKKNIPSPKGEGIVTNSNANQADTYDLQGPRPASVTTLESIEEIPIKIENNCCPRVNSIQ